MITLYHRPQTRSGSIVWLLEELGAPYETKIVASLRPPMAPKQIPPIRIRMAKCPRSATTPAKSSTSPAIALYLTDKFPKAGMGPTVGDNKRGAYLSWLFYCPSVMEPAFMSKRFTNPPVLRREGMGTRGSGTGDQRSSIEEPIFPRHEFSAADIFRRRVLHDPVQDDGRDEGHEPLFARSPSAPALRR